MRIAANMGVLDEVELIGPAIRHLRRIGVEIIVVTDGGSTDGTLDILSEFEADPGFKLVQADFHAAGQFTFVSEEYRRTIEEFRPDWVLFLDADEFWAPAGGDLRKAESLRRGSALRVSRYNVAVTGERPFDPEALSPARYDECFVVARPVADGQLALALAEDTPWIMTGAAPKVMVKPEAAATIALGAHHAMTASGRRARYVTPDDIAIVHVPISTKDRFARKVRNIGQAYQAHAERLKDTQAWHWERWLRIERAGGIDAEFCRQTLDEEVFREGLASGAIQSLGAIFGGETNKNMAPEIGAATAVALAPMPEIEPSTLEEGAYLRARVIGQRRELRRRVDQVVELHKVILERERKVAELKYKVEALRAEVKQHKEKNAAMGADMKEKLALVRDRIALQNAAAKASARPAAHPAERGRADRRAKFPLALPKPIGRALARWRTKRRIKSDVEAIRRSGLFDEAWYTARYGDVGRSGLDPLYHYVRYGAREGRNPNPDFDTAWYSRQYEDVLHAAVNPLVHYINGGAEEGRDPSPLFRTSWYVAQNPDVKGSGLNPLLHFQRFGRPEGRAPVPAAR